MWCKVCRQDVPVMAAGQADRLPCPRCGETMAREPSLAQASVVEGVSDHGIDLGEETFAVGIAPVRPMDDFEDWQFDQQVRRVRRFLSPPVPGPVGGRRESTGSLRGEGVATRDERPRPDEAVRTSAGRSAVTGLAWGGICLGISGSVCGGLLVGESWYAARPDLSGIGVAVLAVGQAIVVASLMALVGRHGQAA